MDQMIYGYVTPSFGEWDVYIIILHIVVDTGEIFMHKTVLSWASVLKESCKKITVTLKGIFAI